MVVLGLVSRGNKNQIQPKRGTTKVAKPSSGRVFLDAEVLVNSWFVRHKLLLKQNDEFQKSAIEIHLVLDKFLKENPEAFWNIYAEVYDGLKALKPYRALHKEFFTQCSPKVDQTILDLGCGTGALEASLQAKKILASCKVTAVDFSAHMISKAMAKFKSPKFVRADISKPWNFLRQSQSFDLITCANCLGFIKNAGQVVKRMAEHLKSGGKIVASMPAENFNNAYILKEHYKDISISPEKIISLNDYLNLYRQCFPIFRKREFDFLVITICNQLLTKDGQSGICFSPTERKLKTIFENSGLKILRLKRTYAKQAFIITAEKPQRKKI